MGIDAIERKISFIGGGLALVLAAIFVPHLLHNTTVIDTAKLTNLHQCPTGYKLVNAVCQRSRIAHPSAYVLQFLLIVVFGAAMVLFTQRSKRSGVAVCALFLGLALGTFGLPFLFLGGWLIIRAFRLQKYGDATFAGSNRRAREKAIARKAGRTAPARSSTKGASRSTARRSSKGAVQPSGPAPSKRYTPKQKPRKR
jgi:hypothetical protein